jgi:hypothetical protein
MTTTKPTKKSSKSKSATQEPRTPSEEMAHEITSTFGDLAPSVRRILEAELSETQRHRALLAFRGSLNSIGDPNRDPRYAIANCGPDDNS